MQLFWLDNNPSKSKQINKTELMQVMERVRWNCHLIQRIRMWKTKKSIFSMASSLTSIPIRLASVFHGYGFTVYVTYSLCSPCLKVYYYLICANAYAFISKHLSTSAHFIVREWFMEQRTPAIAEGATDHIWTFEGFLTFRAPIQ